jgi:hypothetical protein
MNPKAKRSEDEQFIHDVVADAVKNGAYIPYLDTKGMPRLRISDKGAESGYPDPLSSNR